MPKGLNPQLWQRIRGATIECDLGTHAKVLKDSTRACVYTRDYRDLDDLRRILSSLRELGINNWIDYKRDCDTTRGLYGHGSHYWQSPRGTVHIETPRHSVGRQMDLAALAPGAAVGTASRTTTPRC